MSQLNTLKPLAAGIGAVALGATLSLSPLHAAENPFTSNDLPGGYMQLADGNMEGKCGEGKCGGDKTDKEGKCGEGKCGEDKAGGHDSKDREGKCGEGKCGEDKAGDGAKDMEGKCGEGKCGGDKEDA